jgi:hypothetical protein
MIPVNEIHEQASNLFHWHPAPSGVLANLVRHDDLEGEPSYYTIRLYRDNFDKLTNIDRFATARWLETTIGNIQVVIPCYLEVWKRPGLPE